MANVAVLLGHIHLLPMDDGMIANNPCHLCSINSGCMARLSTQCLDVNAIVDVAVLLGCICISPADDGMTTNKSCHYCNLNSECTTMLSTHPGLNINVIADVMVLHSCIHVLPVDNSTIADNPCCHCDLEVWNIMDLGQSKTCLKPDSFTISEVVGYCMLALPVIKFNCLPIDLGLSNLCIDCYLLFEHSVMPQCVNCSPSLCGLKLYLLSTPNGDLMFLLESILVLNGDSNLLLYSEGVGMTFNHHAKFHQLFVVTTVPKKLQILIFVHPLKIYCCQHSMFRHDFEVLLYTLQNTFVRSPRSSKPYINAFATGFLVYHCLRLWHFWNNVQNGISSQVKNQCIIQVGYPKGGGQGKKSQVTFTLHELLPYVLQDYSFLAGLSPQSGFQFVTQTKSQQAYVMLDASDEMIIARVPIDYLVSRLFNPIACGLTREYGLFVSQRTNAAQLIDAAKQLIKLQSIPHDHDVSFN